MKMSIELFNNMRKRLGREKYSEKKRKARAEKRKNNSKRTKGGK